MSLVYIIYIVIYKIYSIDWWPFFVDTHLHELDLQNGSKITLNDPRILMDKYIYIYIYIYSGNACIVIQDFDWSVRVYKAKWQSRRTRVGWKGIGGSWVGRRTCLRTKSWCGGWIKSYCLCLWGNVGWGWWPNVAAWKICTCACSKFMYKIINLSEQKKKKITTLTTK